MSNQNTQKKVFTGNENDANKFKDIEEAIQRAIKTETSRTQDHTQNRKISSAK